MLGVGELINHLQQQVNRINLIWGNGVGQDLVPATRTCSRAPSKAACWETAWRNCRTSRQLQQQFRSEWIAPEAAGDGLLVKQGATLKLADDLLGLETRHRRPEDQGLRPVALGRQDAGRSTPC
ncbi:hypothetical protein P4123_00680 [Pseudomonas aeruginosa]|nr:hypothetical protein [Pseudomonas aeruginosa]